MSGSQMQVSGTLSAQNPGLVWLNQVADTTHFESRYCVGMRARF
jgi:hypothetical protein